MGGTGATLDSKVTECGGLKIVEKSWEGEFIEGKKEVVGPRLFANERVNISKGLLLLD